MNSFEASRKLQEAVSDYYAGRITFGEVASIAYIVASVIDASEVLALIPSEQRKDFEAPFREPLGKREDFFSIDTSTIIFKDSQSIERYRARRKQEDDIAYVGYCRLHRYFTPGNAALGHHQKL
jgi:hypothetical protein